MSESEFYTPPTVQKVSVRRGDAELRLHVLWHVGDGGRQKAGQRNKPERNAEEYGIGQAAFDTSGEIWNRTVSIKFTTTIIIQSGDDRLE